MKNCIPFISHVHIRNQNETIIKKQAINNKDKTKTFVA